MKYKNILIFTVIMLSYYGSSCSKPSIRGNDPSHDLVDLSQVNTPEDGYIQINYTMGRNHYRFEATLKQAKAKASTIRNDAIIQSGLIKKEEFSKYLKKAENFLNQEYKKHPHPSNASSEPCRAPFEVKLHSAGQVKSVLTCRTPGDPSTGRLIRDGEFLLYGAEPSLEQNPKQNL